ncbi:beta-glucosidase/6-phospho-beta-glucosidase/beta-galactosidase [Bradyrhizobium sp. LM3.2]
MRSSGLGRSADDRRGLSDGVVASGNSASSALGSPASRTTRDSPWCRGKSITPEQHQCRTRSRVASSRKSRDCPQPGWQIPWRPPRSSGHRRREAWTAFFPAGFLWGTATSSYQVEGAVNEDGRGPSIWDKFVRIPGKIEDGSTGDRANEHYHRYKEDIALIKELGCKAYRFSVAWPRVFPDGDGQPNPKGLDFYNRLVDELLKNGIEPWLTLYHWDLPQSLQDRFGGWRSTETCKIFGDYAAYVAEHLTDRVKNVFTLNESGRFVYFGYGIGIDAPGLTLPQAEVNQIRHNSALAHGLAVQAVRAHGRRGTRVGPAENIDACAPAIDTPENVRAAEIALREMNAGYLNVIMTGQYTDAFLKFAGRDAPKYTDAELKIISSPVDFLGLNIYAPQNYVVASDQGAGFMPLPIPKSFPHMNSDWLRVGPETLYWVPEARCKNLEDRCDLYQRERHLRRRRRDARRQDLRHRPHHVFAQLSRPASARHRRRRTGARLLPLESDGQL